MRYWLYHQGVPLGTTDLVAGDVFVGEFEPAEAYGSVQPVIRAASAGLWSMGFFHSEGPVESRVSADVFGRAAALQLELRDANGKLLLADFVNIVERPLATEAPVVFARFRHAHAGLAATLPHRPKGDGRASDPDA